MHGFELGNENIWARRSGQRSAAEIVGYFQQLADMIASIWRDVPRASRPKLVGPSEDFTMSDYTSSTCLPPSGEPVTCSKNSF